MIARHLGAWLAAACLAMMLAGAGNLDNLSPSDIQAEWDQSAALQDAIKAEAANARYTRAIAAICGENAVAKDLGNGEVQCQTKHGHKTKQVAM